MPLFRPACRFLLSALFLTLPVGLCAAPPQAAPTVEASVVKIFSKLRAPDLTRPWTRAEPSDASGSGVVIEGKRILTNAHMVFHAAQVEVQGNGSGDRIPATVVALAPGIDLAILKLEDESFFDTHPPLHRLAGLPDVKDEVLAYGFPMGGTNLSITKGIISRIEFTTINSPVSGLRLQVDAAINPGNSGGPAVVRGQMVGLVFSRLGGISPQGIGYVIPNEEIDYFLKATADGRPYAKPSLFDDTPTLENPALRAYLKLDPSVRGVVVHQPFGAASPLQAWDVITHIGDHPLDDQGRIQVRPNLKVDFRYEVQHQAKDGEVLLRIVRQGKAMELRVPAPSEHPQVVPDLLDTLPPFFICGPLVFSRAYSQTLSFLGRWFGNTSTGLLTNPMVQRAYDPPAFPGEELVVVPSPFLPHKLARGYSTPQGDVVKAVNGIPVRNLSHLVEILRDAKDEFIIFTFFNTNRESLVFPRKALMEATDSLLSENGIRVQGSPELLAIWNKAHA